MMISTCLSLLGLVGACTPGGDPLKAGAERFGHYLPLIANKQIALVANHTSVVGGVHLVDTLLASGLSKEQIVRVFAPEHGFRGQLAAGVSVASERDPLTGIAVVSLYGPNKKPGAEALQDVEMVVFDLQDVGTRFYTYISTLHHVMEACAEQHIPLLVLDRPNPNGGYVDGPVLDPAFSSFVGMHPIPVVYGLTMGELAGMINGEGWLKGGQSCELTVIPCEAYYHGAPITLPVSPSPNLGNDHAIRMYPSTCFFEGTVISEGRGTDMPFEIYGHPGLQGDFRFTPVEIPGVARNPKFEGQLCFGADLRGFVPEEGWRQIHLHWLLEAYEAFPGKGDFFTHYFDKLAGTDALRIQIQAGWDEQQIRESWQGALEDYRARRSKYLIYDDYPDDQK